jgi:hypothetical protein
MRNSPPFGPTPATTGSRLPLAAGQAASFGLATRPRGVAAPSDFGPFGPGHVNGISSGG